MTITIITPPASEPVSLAEAKLFLRIDQNAEDALITTLIAAAREAVETGCGRALITRRVRESLDIWRRDAVGGAVLGLGPVTNIVAVRLIASNGSQSVIDPDALSPGRRRRSSAPGVRSWRAGDVALAPAASRSTTMRVMRRTPPRCRRRLRLSMLHVVAALYEARQGDARIPEAARALDVAVCAS